MNSSQVQSIPKTIICQRSSCTTASLLSRLIRNQKQLTMLWSTFLRLWKDYRKNSRIWSIWWSRCLCSATMLTNIRDISRKLLPKCTQRSSNLWLWPPKTRTNGKKQWWHSWKTQWRWSTRTNLEHESTIETKSLFRINMVQSVSWSHFDIFYLNIFSVCLSINWKWMINFKYKNILILILIGKKMWKDKIKMELYYFSFSFIHCGKIRSQN